MHKGVITLEHFKTRYGYFTDEGDFTITDVRTPAPWINVLTNGRYGAVYSQSGSGYSFYIDASRSALTRWVQDLVSDDHGKYLYILDEDTRELFSATYQPVKHPGDYRVIYSPGLVKYITSFERFTVETTIFVSAEHDAEVMMLEILNKRNFSMNISIYSYFELLMGTLADVHREFHRLFFETSFESNTLVSEKHLWSERGWTEPYPFVLYHTSSEDVEGYETDKIVFLGRVGDTRAPEAVLSGNLSNTVGRYVDPVNSLKIRLTLLPYEKKTVCFTVGVADDRDEALESALKFQNTAFCRDQMMKTIKHWREFLSRFKVNVPDKDLEFLLNKWLPYQAIAGRLMARTAYYQTGGAFGYRDQLQDSLAALWLDPRITRGQILLHAKHQRRDGTVQHWWTPLSEGTPKERWSDDLLWLPFVVSSYLEHTGDSSILDETVEFVDGGEASLEEHCLRSIRSVARTLSRRDIPLILQGDWNDGLNKLGEKGRGESFWMSEFYYHVLEKILENFDLGEEERAEIERVKEKIKKAFNEHAWNGEWFTRATADDGEIVGGKEDDRIFLNPQIWAVISGISEHSRIEKAMENVKKFLLKDYGVLLLHPAFDKPDGRIGYITGYAPGARENGGVYTHAATWTLWASWLLKDCDLAERVYRGLSPILRYFRDPDLYRAEPYVTPGNSDGPASPNEGRAGWTWYTGSASWFYRVLIQYFLGILPTKRGILFSPCNRRRWRKAEFAFNIRGGEYHISIENPEGKELPEFRKIFVDGEELEGNLIPYKSGRVEISIVY